MNSVPPTRSHHLALTPADRLRRTLLVVGVVVGLSGIWTLLPAVLAPNPMGFPLNRNLTEATSTWRRRAVLAAEIGAIRGDLWAEAAFAGARVRQAAGFGDTSSSQLNSIRGDAETALAFAPINGAAWLLLAILTQNAPGQDSRVSTFLEMSYFTAPNDLSLALLRVMRAAASSVLANRDIQLFMKSDIRGILDGGPNRQQDIVAAYRNAWPQNKAIFESLVAEIDPAAAALLNSPQSK